MKVLHAFSGGIDSTSVLYQLVRDGHEVVTLHVDLCNLDGSVRWKAERIAVERILKWFSDRKCSIKHIDGGPTTLTGRWFDIEAIALHVGNNIRHDPTIEATTANSSATDLLANGFRSRNVNRFTITEIVARRKPVWLKPNLGKTREQVIADLPPDLLAMTSFCRTPVLADSQSGFTPCGECRTCEETLKYLKDNTP
jgi:7-cyano-7-deazaguanine synthase in queuosine biosynthesis